MFANPKVRRPLAGAAVGVGVVLAANAIFNMIVNSLLNYALLDSASATPSDSDPFSPEVGYRSCTSPGYPSPVV